MRISATAALLSLACLLPALPAAAETFLFTASGYDVNTGRTLSATLNLTGTSEGANGAYDLTAGSGTVTLTTSATGPITENVTLYLPGGSSTSTAYASFDAPPFAYATNYTFDNVIYPKGTTLNDAQGSFLDEYGLLFSSANDHFNFFGQGGYGYVDDTVVSGLNSPLDTVSLTDTTATGVTPEPSSLALLGTGLLGTFGLLRRRRA